MQPTGWLKICEPSMTNFDHTIDPGMDQELRTKRVISEHTARNFFGYVWFTGGQFHEEVWVQYHPRAVRSAPTLDALMQMVNTEFGAA